MADSTLPSDFFPAPGVVAPPGSGDPDVASTSASGDDLADIRKAARGDWEEMKAGIRNRAPSSSKKHGKKAAAATESEDEDEDEDESEDGDRAGPLCGKRFWISVAAFFVALAIVGSYQAYMWMHPQPVGCLLELARPQKFKVDVTDFFRPKVSAAMQLVLSLKNGNMLRSMLLEQCKLTVFEADTGLKLGSVQQNSLVLSPFSTTSVTLSLQGLAGALPQEEQRRLAAMFLAKKALLLTIVATASSRVREHCARRPAIVLERLHAAGTHAKRAAYAPRHIDASPC
jgi:hypothetical protein